MKIIGQPKIIKTKNKDYTKIEFIPDLEIFNLNSITPSILNLFYKRVYDLAACTRGVTIYLNGKKVNIYGFKDYICLYKDQSVEKNKISTYLL